MNPEVSSILVAAHELKAPLALMRQLSLALDLAETDASRARLQSQLIAVSERALRQVTDLTKVARLESGFFTTEPVSVRAVCSSVLNEIAPLFSTTRRSIVSSYHNKSRLAVASSDLLHSIVYNFCINALHYSTHDIPSELSVSDRHGKIRIAVRDYGPALPTAIWRSLQSDRPISPTPISMRPGSSGLGLFIASSFAHFMHADFGAIRHRDGTSFFVELPVSTQLTLNFYKKGTL